MAVFPILIVSETGFIFREIDVTTWPLWYTDPFLMSAKISLREYAVFAEMNCSIVIRFMMSSVYVKYSGWASCHGNLLGGDVGP